MAGASLLALIDDIATVLDDVALMTKVAAKKTAGVLGDDLALNAQQVSGVRAERELPVVWAVAVGSLKNKLILVPAALAISRFAPWAVMPLLMLGGLYLCFEGVEKLAEKWLHGTTDDGAQGGEHPAAPAAGDLDFAAPAAGDGDFAAPAARDLDFAAPAAANANLAALADENVNLAALEADKIKGAIRTDFVLSAEIVVIALGTVADAPFTTQVAVLSAIGLIMTIGVYGVVAGIVKMDDLGLHLLTRTGALARTIGKALLLAAPRLMKALTVIGTAAMFLVGGGILTHGIPPLHHGIERAAEFAGTVAGVGGVLKALTPLLLDVIVGIVAGALTLLGVKAIGAVRIALGKQRHQEPTR